MPIYLKPKDFFNEIVLSKKNGKLTAKAVDMLILLANESSKKLKYKDPMDREDCIGYAIEDLLRYWDRYNPDISTNAFAFFTQVAKHGMAKGWNKIHNKKAGQHISISEEGGIYNI